MRPRFTLIVLILLILPISAVAYTLMIDVVSTWVIIIFFSAIFMVGAWLIYFIFNELFKPLKIITESTNSLFEANASSFNQIYSAEVNHVFENIHNVKKTLDNATNFVSSIGEGKFDADIGSLEDRGLGKALLKMRSQLQGIAQEEQARTWGSDGNAKFSTLLRDNQNNNINDIAFGFIKELVKYVKANQGAVYLIHDTDTDTIPYIKSIAAYAYQRRKHVEKRMEINEGLVGRCIQERDIVYMDDIPNSYISITSGLGNASPKSLVLVPVMVNEVIFGAVEIASFQKMKEYEREFILQACQNLAATIANSKVSDETKKLLSESQDIAKELQEKEDTLGKQAKELENTQAQLEQKILEIQTESIRTKSIVDAVNKTNATIELDLEGRIIDVNDIYLSISEYSRDELIGKFEKHLVPEDERQSGRFDVMWQSIAAGAFNSGEFKRISKSGSELWLAGTYSPILDLEGVPNKIVQFAQFTTEQKEKELEYSSKITAINDSVPLIEMKLDGQLIRASSMFQKSFAFKRRSEIRKTNIADLFEEEFVNSNEYKDLWPRLHKGEIITLYKKMISKSNIERKYYIAMSPTRKVDGTINKIIVIMLDITTLYDQIDTLENNLIEEERENTVLLLEKGFKNETIAQIASVLSIDDIRKQGIRLKVIAKDAHVPSLRVEISSKIIEYNSFLGRLLGERRLQQEDMLQNWLVFDTPADQTEFQNTLTSETLIQKRLKMRVNENIIITFNSLVATIYKSDSSKRFDKLFVFLSIEKIEDTTIVSQNS